MTSMTEMTTRERCEDHARSLAFNLEQLWTRIDVSEADYWEQESPRDSEEARQELEGSVLEIVWEKGEPFTVVFGTGGPHVELRGGSRHDGAGYAVHVYWAGEHVVYRGSQDALRRTGEYFREMVEESS